MDLRRCHNRDSLDQTTPPFDAECGIAGNLDVRSPFVFRR